MTGASEWIEFHGYGQPVPDGIVVDVMFDSGAEWTGPAQDWSWAINKDGTDIIAYRVVEEPRP